MKGPGYRGKLRQMNKSERTAIAVSIERYLEPARWRNKIVNMIDTHL